MHSDAESLCYLDRNPKITVSGDNHSIRDRLVPGQVDHVRSEPRQGSKPIKCTLTPKVCAIWTAILRSPSPVTTTASEIAWLLAKSIMSRSEEHTSELQS